MKLAQLLPIDADREISGLAIDSRKVEPGFIFFCLEGFRSDGHLYADRAAERGAALIVHSKPLKKQEGVLYYQTEDVAGELSRICRLFYADPSRRMTVFGVTGTNGKTTIAFLLRHLYSHRQPAGYIGTIGIDYLDIHHPAELTTPDQIALQATLAEMRRAGVGACAIEFSSHGLTQRRVENIDVDCAIFSNFTRDHLDYHGTMENYFEAKKLLFTGMKPEGIAVLNADDPVFPELKSCCPCPVVSYACRANVSADYQASDIHYTPRYTDFTLQHEGKSYPVRSNLLAPYNVSNLLAALAAAHSQGMSLEELIPLCAQLPQVPGRMEVVDEGQDFHVIVDFAHTPDAFEKLFAFAETVRGGESRILAVFGSAGRRDTGKRILLGEIAGRHCHQVIATMDDPRDEDPAAIGRVILEGAARSGCPGKLITDRAEAIAYALSQAKKDDIVLLLGVGHQLYLVTGDEVHSPYDGDVAVARKWLKARGR